jgi:hypothetical protein
MAGALALHTPKAGSGAAGHPHAHVGQGTMESLLYLENETQHMGGGWIAVSLQVTCNNKTKINKNNKLKDTQQI